MTHPISTAQATERDAGFSRPILALMAALLSLNSISIDVYVSSLPRVASDLHAGASGAQSSLSAFLLGLIVGQLFVGPISDSVGRRRPLMVGTLCYVLSSAVCAIAPALWIFLGGRLLQGLAASTAIVTVRAVVGDRARGRAAGRINAMLFAIMGLMPVLGPLVGAELARAVGWRGLFVAMAGAGLVLWLAAATTLSESLPPQRRREWGIGATARNYLRMFADRRFVGCAILVAATSGSIFAYISGSSFFLQEQFDLSSQTYGLLNGLNSAGSIAGCVVAARLMRTTGPLRLITVGVALASLSSLALFGSALAEQNLATTIVASFVLVTCFGLVVPAASAVALEHYGHISGSAAAVLGAFQYSSGALVVPLVGLGGRGHADLASSIVILSLWSIGLLSFVVLRRMAQVVGGLITPG